MHDIYFAASDKTALAGIIVGKNTALTCKFRMAPGAGD